MIEHGEMLLKERIEELEGEVRRLEEANSELDEQLQAAAGERDEAFQQRDAYKQTLEEVLDRLEGLQKTVVHAL